MHTTITHYEAQEYSSAGVLTKSIVALQLWGGPAVSFPKTEPSRLSGQFQVVDRFRINCSEKIN